MSHKLRCHHCNEVIGVYEPIIVVSRGLARETSRAADPGLDDGADEHYHRTCYADRADTRAA